MATIAVHQWSDKAAGLREMRRVACGPVVVLTIEGPTLARFRLADYAPELIIAEVDRYPDIGRISAALGERCTVTTIPVLLDCVDGVGVGFVSAEAVERGVPALRRALASGEWDAHYRGLRSQPTYDAALRLIVSRPD
jgi:hypothetical protein